MRKMVIVLAAALACGLAFGADKIQVSMPNEVIGFSGTVSGTVATPVGNGWFTLKVVKVLSFDAKNKTKLNVDGVTAAWKDKYVAVGPADPKTTPPLPELKVGDAVIVTARQNEMHLRYTRVVAVKPSEDKTKPAVSAAGDRTVAVPSAQGPAGKGLVMKTYAYKTVGALKIEADVYRPDDATARPVLVWLHGGALIMGSKKWVQPDLMELARAEGYCLVSANYRLAPQARLPQIIEDIRDFMKWVHEKGPELFHADASRVVVAGGSAGGYLTEMTGIMEPRPKGLVAYYGYGDVDGPWYTTPSEFYRKQALVSKADAYQGMTPEVATEQNPGPFNRGRLYLYLRQNGLWTKEVSGFDPATEKKKLDPYCPVRNITAKYPPIVMLHGTNDTDVPCQESRNMAEQLKKRGVHFEFFEIAGGNHGLGRGDKPSIDKAMARAREFIKECLSASAPKTEAGR